MIFLLASLITWRLTAWLVYENATQGLRDSLGVYALGEDNRPSTFAGRVLSCFWCCSWAGAVLIATCLLLFDGWSPRTAILSIPALSASAILLNHWARINLYAERE